MMIKPEEKSLQDFFQKHKTEINDNGFTKKTMHRLPHKVRWFRLRSVMILAALVAGVLFSYPQVQSIMKNIYSFSTAQLISLGIASVIVFISIVTAVEYDSKIT